MLRGQRLSGCLGFLMVYALNLLIIKTLYWEISPFKIFIYNLIIWALIYQTVSYHKYLKKIRTLFLSIIGFLLFALLPTRILEILFITKPDVLEALKNTSELINSPKIIEFTLWSAKYMFGYTTEVPKSFDMILLVIIFIFVSTVFANLIIKKRRLIYFVIPIALFIFEWYRYIDGISALFNIYISGLILYYILMKYDDNIHNVNKENSSFKYYEYKPVMVFAGIMVIIIIFTSNVIIGTLSVGAINDKLSNMFPSILDLRSEYERASHSKFSFGETPFQPLGNRLGGSIDLKDTLVMRAESNKPLVYLRGRVENTYTGYNWYSDNDIFIKGKKKSLGIEEVSFNDESETVEITIYPDNILTSTVFSPYFPIEYDSNGRKIRYNNDLEMYFSRGFFKGIKGSYTIKSILPTTKNGEINIRDSRSIEKDMYLQLPDALPDRVSKLAAELTKQYRSDYEKMKALERYLAENYEYNLTVPDIPKESDFVDHFLFDSKTGYCTYYASSLAVLGRTLDIPTRYVVGFILPEERGEDGLYEVTADRAHAWVEAFIDGKGWITFEPTAPYYVSAVEETLEEESSVDSSSLEQASTDRINRNMRDLMADEDMTFSDSDYRYVEKKNIDIQKLVILFLAAIIVLRILYTYYRNRKTFSKADARKYVIKNYYIIISLYSFIEKMDFEKYSPYQLIMMIDKNLVEIDASDDIIDSINRAFYSNENIGSHDIETIDELRTQVEKLVVRNIGQTAYFYHKYVLGDIYRKGDMYGTLWKNTSPQC